MRVIGINRIHDNADNLKFNGGTLLFLQSSALLYLSGLVSNFDHWLSDYS